MSRTTRTATFNDLEFEVYEPTDGQVAIMAQQVRAAKRAASGKPDQSGFLAMGVFLTVLEKLIIDEEIRDRFVDELIDGDLDLIKLVSAILGGDAILNGEVVTDAAPRTVVKRTKRS